MIWKSIKKKIHTLIFGKSYYDYSCDLTKLEFGEIRRYFRGLKKDIDENRRSHLEFEKALEYSDNIFEIWYVYLGKDDYGDNKYILTQIGKYNGDKQKLYYKTDLKKYIDNKYFKNESKED